MFKMKKSLRKICILGLAASMFAGNLSLSAVAPSKKTFGALYDYSSVGAKDGDLIPVISMLRNQGPEDAKDGKIYLIDREAEAAGTLGGVGIKLVGKNGTGYNLVKNSFGNTATANGKKYEGVAMYLRMAKQGEADPGEYNWIKVWENGEALKTKHHPRITLENLKYENDKLTIFGMEILSVETKGSIKTIKTHLGGVDRDIATIDFYGNILSLDTKIGTLEEDEEAKTKTIKIALDDTELMSAVIDAQGNITVKPSLVDIYANDDGTKSIKLGSVEIGTIDTDGKIAISGENVGEIDDEGKITISKKVGTWSYDKKSRTSTIRVG